MRRIDIVAAARDTLARTKLPEHLFAIGARGEGGLEIDLLDGGRCERVTISASDMDVQIEAKLARVKEIAARIKAGRARRLRKSKRDGAAVSEGSP